MIEEGMQRKKSIDINSNIWLIPSDNVSYVDYYPFDFTKIKSPIFRYEMKKVIFEILKTELVKASSVRRYYSSIRLAFQDFIELYKLDINYFSDITFDIAEKYIFYLKSRNDYSRTTNSSDLAGVKAFIEHGIFLKLPNYPKYNPFPKNINRIFGVDDELKTKYVADDQIKRIENALDLEQNVYIKAATVIAKETGLRISDVLTIRTDCILHDFVGFPILYTYATKGENERYVTASQEVIDVVNQLKNLYIDNPQQYLFFRKNSHGRASLIKQHSMRNMLKNFCNENDIDHQTFHAFRHTVGTTMLNNGASGSQIQEQLGHKSLHSASLYAKMKSKTVDREYYRMPILGIDPNVVKDADVPESLIMSLPLPDGTCENVIRDNHICEDSYKCLFCSLYKTFKEDLPTHKSHLERIRKNADNYMADEGVNSLEMLKDIELALLTIIERLENE